MARLTKHDVEVLMATVDTTLLQGALAVALRRVLDVDAFAGDWPALVRLAGERAGWDGERRGLLVEADPMALAGLAVELNERRSFD